MMDYLLNKAKYCMGNLRKANLFYQKAKNFLAIT